MDPRHELPHTLKTPACWRRYRTPHQESSAARHERIDCAGSRTPTCAGPRTTSRSPRVCTSLRILVGTLGSMIEQFGGDQASTRTASLIRSDAHDLFYRGTGIGNIRIGQRGMDQETERSPT